MGRPRVIKLFSKNVDLNQGKLGENAVSDYYSNYVRHRDFVRVRSMKPPPDQPRPQYPPMETSTTNMKIFVPKDLSAKRDLIKPEENKIVSEEPLQTETVYKDEFKRKSPLPVITKRPKTNTEKRRVAAKFDDKTMNKHFYKDWKFQPQQRFGELPSFTHSLIFPDKAKEGKQDVLRSRTHTDYPYKTIPKIPMVKAADPNIKVGQGDRYLETTHRSAFKYIPGNHMAERSAKKELRAVTVHPKMEVKTKYQLDFPRKEKYPLPPKQAIPPPATLEIKMNNRHVFETEQRQQYHGWDVNEHKRPDPAKLSDNTEVSKEPMMTETMTAHDFQIQEGKIEKAAPVQRPPTNVNVIKAKFNDKTMNRMFYQDWGARQRLRYGDFHEACNKIHNVPKGRNMESFDTTTKTTFVKKTCKPRDLMKPPSQTIDTSQEHDFNTVTRMAYKYPPLSAYELEDFKVKC